MLGRLGGDEFAVALPSCRPDEAEVVAESIVAAIRRHEPGDQEIEAITASVGVALFGTDQLMSYATLVSEADTAMYAAKDAGGDDFRVFHPDAIRAGAPRAPRRLVRPAPFSRPPRQSLLRPGRLVAARAGCGRHETPGT